jgi:formiminotetrahydrofolate cyclodeaminase
LLLDSLKPYLDDLASAAPVPGGGAAAAVTVAQGLALLAMVCNLTIGKKRFAAVEAETIQIRTEVTAMMADALSLAEADMSAFGGVMEAYRLPAESDAQRAARQDALTRATRAAAEPPFRLMQVVAEALPLANRLERIGNPNVLSDVLVGRHLLHAGMKASRENVEVNLANLAADDAFVGDLRARMAALETGC